MLALRDDAEAFFDFSSSPSDSQSTCAATEEDESVGTTIGGYRLIERLGEGGCGVVYLAEQEHPVRRRVALKIIRLGMDTQSVIARFRLECQALAMMDHPNIARVLDVGATPRGRPYFVMQWVDGTRITEYCRSRDIGIPERLKLFIRVCFAVQHAHQKGVIHRDIKPSNVLVWEHDGEAIPKVIDFGIAKATSGGIEGASSTVTGAGQLIGTPAYMSPEQASGNPLDVDTRSDIFSLGALLYELLADRPPFDPETFRNASQEEIRRILTEVEPLLPSLAVISPPFPSQTFPARSTVESRRLSIQLRGDLDRIVMMALAKERRHRYPTADALAADISRFLNYEPVQAQPPSRMYQLGKLIRRNKLTFAASAAVLVSLLTALGVSIRMVQRETLARNTAEQARLSEAELRKKSDIGHTIARAAVMIRYKDIERADQLLASIPPELAQPSLESAGTFQTLGLWHAEAGRWREAGNRFAALVYSLASVDSTDSETISLNMLPASAALCEAGNFDGYEALRTMAIRRFGSTLNPIVAEQIVKACLLRPASRELLQGLAPLDRLMRQANTNQYAVNYYEQHLAAWRHFGLALLEFRAGDYEESAQWLQQCLDFRNHNGARDAMALIVRSMVLQQQGKPDEAKANRDLGQCLIQTCLTQPGGIFAKTEPHWQDWVNAKILLREAEQANR
jgi:serine/threonine protein kinase